MKERVLSGEELYGEYDEAWVFELKKQLDDYSQFLKEQVPALKKWRADRIIYHEETSGLISKTTQIKIHDEFLNKEIKRSYEWTASSGSLKTGYMQMKEYWVSAWLAQFVDSYSPYFYMNNLIPGFENELPVVDPEFKKIVIGPFCPGASYDMPVDTPINAKQESGTIKEIVFNYGDNMDSFQVNFTDHEGIRPTKIGGDKTKTIKVDPNKKLKALRFYYAPGGVRGSLRSISFVYDDNTESEKVMEKNKQEFIDVPILNDYYLSNIKAAREQRSSTADFSFWFWVEMTFKPGMPVVD